MYFFKERQIRSLRDISEGKGFWPKARIYFENTCLELKIFKANKGPMPVLSQKKKEVVWIGSLN